MKVKIWGTRGDVVSPGPDTVKYGGNTTCVEVIGAQGDRLILDAGIGITRLGKTLIPPPDITKTNHFHLLLSHTHIDHIQGFVFFPPIFFPSSIIHIYCPQGSQHTLQEVINGLFATQYSPLENVANLPSKIHYEELNSDFIDIPPFKIYQIPVDHPGGCCAYKITENDRTLLFVTDHEARNNKINKNLIEKGKNIDLLIHDAQFTEEEYVVRKIGYGHSSFYRAVKNAREMAVSHLLLFSHDPNHSDAIIDRFVEKANEWANGEFIVSGAQEGKVYEI